MSGLTNNIEQVAKTTKLFINGEFPRTESGRSFTVMTFNQSQIFANLCQASRKDLRQAVEAAQAAQPIWAKQTAYLRGQILYRMAEMLEGKRGEFKTILSTVTGVSFEDADTEVTTAIDSLIYYAGFADKFTQVLASVNPVSGPYHNFTTLEAVGVVGMIYDSPFSLSQWVAQVASVLCTGNALVVIWDGPGAAVLSELGEVFKTSDLPPGVINLLSGKINELAPVMADHMEVHSLLVHSNDQNLQKDLESRAVANMKRTVLWKFKKEDIRAVQAFTEAKTIWHPIGH